MLDIQKLASCPNYLSGPVLQWPKKASNPRDQFTLSISETYLRAQCIFLWTLLTFSAAHTQTRRRPNCLSFWVANVSWKKLGALCSAALGIAQLFCKEKNLAEQKTEQAEKERGSMSWSCPDGSEEGIMLAWEEIILCAVRETRRRLIRWFETLLWVLCSSLTTGVKGATFLGRKIKHLRAALFHGHLQSYQMSVLYLNIW